MCGFYRAPQPIPDAEAGRDLNAEMREGERLENSNPGKCLLCGYEGQKGPIARHLEKCARNLSGKNRLGSVLRLRFEAAGYSLYWIYVDARGDATFGDLDDLLRGLWLECCGHMSAFRLGRTEPDMNAKVGRILHAKGLKFNYEYDFGSTTTLTGQVVGACEASVGRDRVRLLARNNPPAWICAQCDAPATRTCTDCMYGDADDLFCETHAASHSCGEDYLLPVVNSPRMGVCGYGADLEADGPQ